MHESILRCSATTAIIMGPEIGEFERQLAAFGGAPFALACGNGTDALLLPLMAGGIGPGDAVFCPSFTFAATAEAMPLVGAAPVFVDIDPDTYNMDAASLEAAIAAVKREGSSSPGRSSPSTSSACPPTIRRSPGLREADGLIADRRCRPGLRLHAGRPHGSIGPMSPPPASSRPSRSAATAMAAPS